MRIEELGFPSSLTQAIIDDKSLIIYRPRLNQITGGVLSTILLHQIIYWANKSQNLFYKFKEPCNHDLYKSGDSWTEELGFTRWEFEGALKNIARKYNPKKDELPTDSFVIFYTDIRRLTWYSVNWHKLNSEIERAFIRKEEKPLYVNRDTNFTYSGDSALPYKETKNTTENNQQTTPATSEARASTAQLATPVFAAASLLEKYAIGHDNAQRIASKFSLPFIQKKLAEIELKFATGHVKNLQGYIITVFDKTDSEESLFEQETKAKKELTKQQQKEAEILARKKAQMEEQRHREYIAITDRLISEANVVELRWFAEWLGSESRSALGIYQEQGLKSSIVMAYYRRYLYNKYYHISEEN